MQAAWTAVEKSALASYHRDRYVLAQAAAKFGGKGEGTGVPEKEEESEKTKSKKEEAARKRAEEAERRKGAKGPDEH